MSRSGIATGSIDLLQDDRGFNETHTQAPILPRNKRSEIAGLRKRTDKGFRIRSLLVEFSPVAIRKLLAQSPHSQSQLCMRFVLHHTSLLSFSKDTLSTRANTPRVQFAEHSCCC